MPHRAVNPNRALVLGAASDVTRRLAAYLSGLGLRVIGLPQLARKDVERVRSARVVVFCESAQPCPDARQLQDCGLDQAILLAIGAAVALPVHATLPLPLHHQDLVRALARAGYQTPTNVELSQVNETLLRLVNGNRAVTAELVSSLLVTATTDIGDYQRECADRRWPLARSLAHRLAGTARMVDCATLIALSVRAEALCAEGDADNVQALNLLLVPGIQRLCAALRDLEALP